MARLGRYFLPDQPFHVIQRGNNRKPIFFVPEDYTRYREWLIGAASEYDCAIHAWAQHARAREGIPGIVSRQARRRISRWFARGDERRLGARRRTLQAPRRQERRAPRHASAERPPAQSEKEKTPHETAVIEFDR